MIKMICVFLLMMTILSGGLVSTTQAQQRVSAQLEVMKMAEAAWEKAAPVWERLGRDLNITIEKRRSGYTLRNLFPKEFAAIDEMFSQTYGYYIVEDAQGFSSIFIAEWRTLLKNNGADKNLPPLFSPPGPVPPGTGIFPGGPSLNLGPLGTIYTFIGMYRLGDSFWEAAIINALTERGWDRDEAAKEANYLTDRISELANAFMLNEDTARLLNALERFLEHGQDRYEPGERRHGMWDEFLNRPNRTPPPQGNGPGEYVIGLPGPGENPCPTGYTDFSGWATDDYVDAGNNTDPCKSGKNKSGKGGKR